MDDEQSPPEKIKHEGQGTDRRSGTDITPTRLPSSTARKTRGTKEQWMNKKFLRIGKMVVRGRKDARQISVDVIIKDQTNGQYHKGRALIDSGCEGVAIDREWAEQTKLNLQRLHTPIRITNADGTDSKGGRATHYFKGRMRTGDHIETIDAVVTDLEKQHPIFLGMTWLKRHNPEVDWENGTITFSRCPSECDFKIRTTKTNDEGPTPNYEKEFPKSFNASSHVPLAEHREFDFEINLKDEKPVTSKIYPLTKEEMDQLRRWLDEGVKIGQYKPSKSPYASPMFFKHEPNQLRPLIDYRRLNEKTIGDKFPIPRIKDMLENMSGMKVFSKMDVRWGFNNIRIKDTDTYKGAFITPLGLYEPTVMQFGFKNAPSTFQRFLNWVFKEEIATGKVYIYIDDILVCTMTKTENRELVRQVLRKLQKHHLCLKPSKCEFEKDEIVFLGMRISHNKIMPNKTRLQAIKEWPTPKKKRDIRKFLGLMNYYRRFIHNFANIAKPLYEMTKEGEWKWGEKQDLAFAEMKKAFTGNEILHMPKDEGQYILETDASNYATGAILSQIQDGKKVLIDMDSQQMNPAERNYQIYDKEMLAIIKALQKWRKQLLPASEKFIIQTDHNNLKYYRDPQKLTRRQARWSAVLQEFNYVIEHISGKSNTKADILSRRPGYDEGEEDNEEIVVLKEDKIRRKKYIPRNIEEEIVFHRKEIEEDVIQRMKKEKWWKQCDDGTLLYRGKLYVPPNPDLREHILHINHNPPSRGHPGKEAMHDIINRQYYWPSIKEDIKTYCDTCEICQKTKTNTRKVAPLNMDTRTNRPWDTISWDIVGPLPESGGFNAILTIVDKNTKGVIFEPTNTELSTAGAAKIFIERVYRDHGMPERVVSDRGPQFVSKFMKEIYKRLHIEANPSTAYHPQTNGQAERANQEIEKFLRLFVNSRKDDWHEWIPLGQFAINNRKNRTTGYSPFFLDKGRHPKDGLEIKKGESNVPAADEWLATLINAREAAKTAIMKAAADIERTRGRTTRPRPDYKPGEKVLLDTRHLETTGTKKLDSKYAGPFRVEKKIGRGAYRLDLPKTWKIHPTFNESLLKPYNDPKYTTQEYDTRPPPQLVEGIEEYIVEEIVAERENKRRRKHEYLVKWEGYPREDMTWEPAENLKDNKVFETYLKTRRLWQLLEQSRGRDS